MSTETLLDLISDDEIVKSIHVRVFFRFNLFTGALALNTLSHFTSFLGMVHFKNALFTGIVSLSLQTDCFTTASSGEQPQTDFMSFVDSAEPEPMSEERAPSPKVLSLINPAGLKPLDELENDDNDESAKLLSNDNIKFTLGLMYHKAEEMAEFVDWTKTMLREMVTVKKVPIDSFEVLKSEVEKDFPADELTKLERSVTPPEYDNLRNVDHVRFVWNKYSHFLSAWNLIQLFSKLIDIYAPTVSEMTYAMKVIKLKGEKAENFRQILLQLTNQATEAEFRIRMLELMVPCVIFSIDSGMPHEYQVLKAITLFSRRLMKWISRG